MNNAFDLIKEHEDVRLMPYKDTVGKITIGYGRNLSDKGISQAEADLLFSNDAAEVLDKMLQYSWYTSQTVPRQAVLADMAFNLGIDGLLKFKTLIGCLMVGDHQGAADAMRTSKWASQVGRRAVEDIAIMETGDWPKSA